MTKLISASAILLLTLKAPGQDNHVKYDHPAAAAASLISGVPARCIGFNSKGIRMSAIAVYEKDPKLFYAGSGNGGVVKTTDAGVNTSIIFDKQGSSNIGAIAASQNNPDIVWIGTGEAWQRNSVGGGDGIYKSTDGGQTWQHMGLEKCHSFVKIIIHPKNENIVFAAAMGSAWGYGPDRGIYKTTDGGKTWRKVLYHDERSAGTEVVMDPKDPDNMMAALWDHIHRPYGWFESGPGSAMYRSTDGGETWKKISAGLPAVNLGRIAIDYFLKNPKQLVAAIEVAPPLSGYYRSSDGGKTWRGVPGLHLNDDSTVNELANKHHGMYRPFYNHAVKFHPTDVNTFYYANPYHKTNDGGKTFTGEAVDDHGFWINPKDPTHFLVCVDGGIGQGRQENGKRIDMTVNLPAFDQVYGTGYDMRKLYRVFGNMQDYGRTILGRTQSLQHDFLHKEDNFDLPAGMEGGSAMADPNDWTTVYCTQIGFFLDRVDLKTGTSKALFEQWAEARKTGGWATHSEYDRYKVLDTPMRANWSPAFHISPWNSHTLYFGTQFLLKSTNRGDSWQVISPDLTHNKPEWQVPDGTVLNNRENSTSRCYQTIKTISESPLQRDVIWVGTDDGYIQLTKDGGKTWTNLTKNIPGIPEYTWISCIEASKFAAGRAYVAISNYRNFDLNTYLYMTDDFGRSWKEINGNMPPQQPCNVIREGRKNPDLLYVGTESNLFISLDRGATWDKYQDFEPIFDYGRNYFPTVRVSDLHIHPRELDVIIAAHGRGIWIMHARALEEMTPENRAKDVHFTTPGNIYMFPNQVRSNSKDMVNGGDNNTQPGTFFSYYLKRPVTGEVTIKVYDSSGKQVPAWHGGELLLTGTGKVGINKIFWELTRQVLAPGAYKAVLTVEGKEYTQTVTVEDVSDEALAGINNQQTDKP